MYLAHIIARQGKTYIVEDENSEQHKCHVRTNAIDAVCGDIVDCETKNAVSRRHHKNSHT